ncbi:MAG: thiol-disulfide oxidoreductase DCC family protein [Gaiellales bacterium]
MAGDGIFIVLYDRDCAFCTWVADWIRRADRDGRINLVSLQDAPDDPQLAPLAHDYDLRCELHAVDEHGAVHAGGDAVLSIQERLPGGAIITAWRTLPFAEDLAEWAYGIAARHRDLLARMVGLEATPACELDG